jgi:hypothetical protein
MIGVKAMIRCLSVVLLLTSLTLACTPYAKFTPGKNISDLQTGNIHNGENTLPSGRKIIVSNISKVDFPNGPSALVLSYTTTVAIDDKKDLRAEVDEIWSLFVKDVESENLKAAALRPSNGSKGYGFVFEKREDGVWHNLDDEKK